MAFQESGLINTSEFKCKPLPWGFLVEPDVKGAQLFEQTLGICFNHFPKELVYNLRNRFIALAFLCDVAPSPRLDFLKGKRSKLTYGGTYHPDYHTLFVWQEDRDCLGKNYLHELAHAFCYQPYKPHVQMGSDEGNVLDVSRDTSLLSSLIERRIVRIFIAEGLAVWISSAASYRGSLLRQGITDIDQEVRACLAVMGLDFDLDDERFEYIVPKAVEKYHKAVSFRGKKRKKEIGRVDYYLQHFWQRQGFIFVKDTLNHMIDGGFSTPEAINSLTDNFPQNFSQIQDPLELAEALLKKQ